MAALSLAAPWIATHDPLAINPLQRLKPPSAAHYFGTDALGRDIFSRAVWGGRVSLVVAVSVAVLASILGVVLGLLRSEEHTSELQSLMRISYAVFCLKKKKRK